MKFSIKRLLVGAIIAMCASCASADVLFTFNQSGSFGSGPFGTVLLHSLGPGSNEVQVTVTPQQPCCGFVDTGLEDFGFQLAVGFPAITSSNFVGGVPSGWTFNSPGGNTDGAGPFQYTIDCVTVCGTGGNAPNTNPFIFTLQATGLTEATFVANASGHFFMADLCVNIVAGQCATTGPDGQPQSYTGAVWTSSGGPPNQVPEPGTVVLLGLALSSLAVMQRRRVG
jgi:hypothetical protein